MPKEPKTKSDQKVKRIKKQKDPNEPKKGLSAYMFFSQDQRTKIQAENPEAGFGEIGKLLGEAWKKLSDNEKKPYTDMAERDKQRYIDEKAAMTEQKQ